MNLILLSRDDLVEGTDRAVLSGRRLRHVQEVHRAQVGDTLRVGLVNERTGLGVVTALTPERLELRIDLAEDPPAPLPLVLLLALPRPKTLRRVLQCVTAMGVKRIFLMNTWRVEKSFWKSPLLAPARLMQELVLGLEQARDTVLPEVTLEPRFKPFVEDRVPSLVEGTQALVAHPEHAAVGPASVHRPVTLAVGPEGGFIAYEIELLRAHGFAPISLGQRPLRVEHAVPALLGRIFRDDPA